MGYQNDRNNVRFHNFGILVDFKYIGTPHQVNMCTWEGKKSLKSAWNLLIKTNLGAQKAGILVSLMGIGPPDPPVKEFFKNSHRGQRYRQKHDRRPGLDAQRSTKILTVSTKAALTHKVHQSSSLKLVVTPNIIGHISGQKNQILTEARTPGRPLTGPKTWNLIPQNRYWYFFFQWRFWRG